jgi:VanZ family protein
MTRTLFKVLAWAALIAITAATLSPIGLRPRLPVPVDLERSAAFLSLGLLFALAYPRRIWLALAIVLIGAFGLEWLQELRPDRHGRFDDALIKSLGAMIGLGAGWITVKLAEATFGRNSRA